MQNRESPECPFLPISLLKMMHGRHLAIRKFSCKKDCEEMISIFSQSLSVISFRNPHAGRTFASILPPAIYVPQT